LRLSLPSRSPKCKGHTELERKVFEKNKTTLYTDNCKYCKGVWLDGGELKLLRNKFFAEITNKNDFFKRIADFIFRN
jgi:Zn-finger nucleic acid-binding protein